MTIDFLLEVFKNNRTNDAVIWKDKAYSYDWLLQELDTCRVVLDSYKEIKAGKVVALHADFSPRSLVYFLALVERQCVLVPLTDSVKDKKAEFFETAEVQIEITIDADDQVSVKTFDVTVNNPVTQKILTLGHPGLILFSSGSTGKSKGALHDLVPLLNKFKTARHAKRTITFLLFDHIGGVNTALYILSNGGTIVTVQGRTTDEVCRAIQNHRVQSLPTSPTFINLLLLSGDYEKYDISSLELVTYGTEAMPESTLKRFHAALPNIKLQQTYGLSEIGIMRSKSESSDSLWVQIGGEGFETRVVDGLLEIKAQSAMLGYLNAPSPFTDDGWFITGDRVEVKGDYFKILGRESEMINVGGEKVYPAEVEGYIAQMPGVIDVTVTGEDHAITGRMVKATLMLEGDESKSDFRKRMAVFLNDKLPQFKIPQKIVITDNSMHGARFKKMRKGL
jgi:long-chain acyl-CoA synthetase